MEKPIVYNALECRECNVPKGWGHEVIFENNELYCGKLLVFKKGARFSLHYHMIKDETWYVQEGEFEIVSVTGDDGTQYVLDETDTWDIYNLTELFSNALATEDTNMYASQNNTVMEPTIQQDEELGDIRRLSGL